jgi:ATP-binding cassette subfamily B protein
MLNSFLSGIRVVKAFAQEKKEAGRFREHNEQLTATRLTLVRSWHTFFPLISFVFGVGGFIIWYFGGRAVLSGRITLGILLAFISYLGMFYGPFSSMTQLSQWLTRFVVAVQRIFNILDQKPEIKVESRPIPLKKIEGYIEFKEVNFGYHSHLPVLKNVSFSIKPGEVIGIVGKSGAGKSTIINLLCRFYDVTEGGVFIDGIDIRNFNPMHLRQHIGLVLQDSFLFRGSIAENIAYGNPGANMEEIIQAATIANAHDFITSLPDGYDTRLGEAGAGISSGEKQRISIARAILSNPRILILDEATTNIDVEAEAIIQEALQEVVKGRTTIIIAHRFTTIKQANRIMVIERGSLIEMGHVEELLEKRGRFYELYKLQSHR